MLSPRSQPLQSADDLLGAAIQHRKLVAHLGLERRKPLRKRRARLPFVRLLSFCTIGDTAAKAVVPVEISLAQAIISDGERKYIPLPQAQRRDVPSPGSSGSCGERPRRERRNGEGVQRVVQRGGHLGGGGGLYRGVGRGVEVAA